MRKQLFAGLAATGLTVVSAIPSYADISAQQALDGVIGYYESFGYDIKVDSQGSEGGLLSVSNLSVTMDIPEEDTSIVISTGPFTLNETGDGAVEIILPSSSTYQVSVLENGAEMAKADVDVAIVEFSGRISGDPKDVQILSSFQKMDLNVASIDVQGNNFPVTAVLNLADMASDYRVQSTEDEHRRIDTVANLGKMNLTIGAKDPGGDGFLSLNAEVEDVKSEGLASMLALSNVMEAIDQNPMALFTSGFTVDGEFEYGASHIDMAFKDQGTNFAFDANSTGGLARVEISKDVIAYNIVQEGVDLDLSSSDLPIPGVKLNYDELSFAFSVPLAKSDAPQDFNFSTALRNLEVTEAIWSMVDPGRTIPRDPATIAIDISGKAKVLADILDAETLENLDDGGMPPILPLSAKLNELLVSFGGAELTGTGSATIDLENGGLIGGMPAPVGSIDLSLIGGFGLVDKLSSMGLVPQDAGLVVKGMVGAFAKPVGDDHFETTIEFVEGGGILANGQAIQ